MKIENLISNAERIKNKTDIKRTQVKVLIKRFADLGIEDPYIILEKPTTSTLISASERKSEVYTLSESMVSPNIRDKELMSAYAVNNSEALIKKMFTDEEIQDMTAILGEMITQKNRAQIVNDIKN